jgi:hypothetical protein
VAGVLIGSGVLLALVGGIFLLLAAVYALSIVMQAWAAALIVGGGVALIAVLCVSIGVSRFKSVRAVPKTAETVKRPTFTRNARTSSPISRSSRRG